MLLTRTQQPERPPGRGRSRRWLLRASAALAGSAAMIGTPAPGTAQAGPLRPFPYQTTYAEGSLRPDHRSQGEQDDVVRVAYNRWKERYFVEAGFDAVGNPLYRVALGGPETENYWVTVSEGQGYGMVIVAYLAGHDPAAQVMFDGLWRFARINPSAIEPRLMSWRVPPGEGSGQDSAFDGDCDIAYGLLLADAQWGSTGPIDYAAAAGEVIAGMLAATIGPRSRLPMLGDWVEPDGVKYNQNTPRTSDFMLGHFRAFQQATDDPVWDEVVAACHRVTSSLQRHYSPETGLLPDFVQPISAINPNPRPADPGFLDGPHDDAFGYNAGRTPWRLGVDALLSGNALSRSQASAMAIWAEGATGGDPYALGPGYYLDGEPLNPGGGFTTFFAAPLGVAAMTIASGQAWLNAIFDAVADHPEDYYEDSVTLLCLLVMTGNWWDPVAR